MAKALTELRRPMRHVRVTITLHLTREYRFRLWLGKCLIGLSMLVLGCTDFVINESEKDGNK